MAGQGGQGAPGLAPPPPQADQQAPPHQMPQPGPGLQGPPGPQPPPFQSGGYGQGPAPNGYASQPPPSAASPGPGKGPRLNRGPGGPPTPQLNQQMPYPDPRAAASPQVGHPVPDHRGAQFSVGNALAELDLERLPAHQKKVESDWFAIFNPMVPRVLDVDLVHTLQHESVVCCVRFSHDGKYVATGCNRSAQIFDVVTGQKLFTLQDESVDAVGDLYIRSVCFSPDGRYLATGAEDKQIRVWDIASRTIRNTFSGHEQDIYSLDFARDGRTIASGSGDRTVRLWDIEAGQNILTLSIEDGVTTVAISPDTKFVAAGSLDKSVRVWDATTGYLVERLEGADGHKDSVYSVAFAPNGKDLVSGSLDKTIKMWELVAPRGGNANTGPKGGRCIRTFEGHKASHFFHRFAKASY
jgi:glucose repression regulatory protein TUP1